jgi:hypothetical protein
LLQSGVKYHSNEYSGRRSVAGFVAIDLSLLFICQ